MLSFWSIGARVGFTLRLRAVAPLNLARDQNLTAVTEIESGAHAVILLT